MTVDWETYFITMCFLVAMKSKDESTKCGCIAVSHDFIPLAMGYNGPPRGFPDGLAPQTRPEKYSYFEHSERNCVYSAARHGIILKDATFFITGPPCCDCLRAMIQVGAKKIVYGPNMHSGWNEEAKRLNESLMQGQDIEVIHFNDVQKITNFLDETKAYLLNKVAGLSEARTTK
jgi:dCMP deaminase